MKGVAILILMWITLAAQSQTQVSDLIQSFELSSSVQKINTRLDNHLAELKLRKSKLKSEQEYLAEVFEYTHRKLLRSYIPYSQFNELIERGRYDCLSATALFSVIFDRLGVKHQIIETNYHIFLMAQTAQGAVLIETTDRFNGVVTDAKKIANRIEGYQQNQLLMSSNKHAYAYQANIYREVSSSELIGLLYFNQAVRLFNEHQLERCSEKLDKALERHDNPRAEELAVIVFHAVQSSNLEMSIKSTIQARYQKYLYTVRPVLASR